MPDVKAVDSGFLFSYHPLILESGKTLRDIQVAYTIAGNLSKDADVVLVTHALTGDQFVCSENSETRRKGWWSHYVGPNRPIDTNKYCVICQNVLGGCSGTTGPSTPRIDTSIPGASFPIITIGDMVKVQNELLKSLGINKLHSIVGGSMGGMQVLEWLRLFPEWSNKYLVIASSYRQPVQNIGFHDIGRRAIMLDPVWADGQYNLNGNSPNKGLSIARMIGHMTYLSSMAFTEKFGRRLQDKNEKSYSFEDDFQVESYLRHQGISFTSRFDANSYLYITKAVDYFDQSYDYAYSLEDTYKNFMDIKNRFVDLVGFSTDWLYPSTEMKKIYEAIMFAGGKSTFTEFNSEFGHDAFLMPNPEFEAYMRDYFFT